MTRRQLQRTAHMLKVLTSMNGVTGMWAKSIWDGENVLRLANGMAVLVNEWGDKAYIELPHSNAAARKQTTTASLTDNPVEWVTFLDCGISEQEAGDVLGRMLARLIEKKAKNN